MREMGEDKDGRGTCERRGDREMGERGEREVDRDSTHTRTPRRGEIRKTGSESACRE